MKGKPRQWSARKHSAPEAWGFDRIAVRLNEEHVPTRAGRPWHGIVVNRILTGKRHQNCMSYAAFLRRASRTDLRAFAGGRFRAESMRNSRCCATGWPNGDQDAEGRANLELRLKVVTAQARYLGLIVEKKQVARAFL